MPSVSLSRALAASFALSAVLGFSGQARADFLYGRLVPAGAEPNGNSTDVDVSSNGRTVVFSSDASNWAASSYNGDKAIAVDLDTGMVEIVSSTDTGTVFRGEAPVVSGDGRYVAFLTYGNALLGSGWQVGRKDRRTGVLEKVSANAAGEPASDGTNDNDVAISANGRYVAFDTAAPNFVPPGSGTQIFVKDMQTGGVEMASVRSDGSPAGSGDERANAAGNAPAGSGDGPTGGGACRFLPHALSADGRYIAMTCSTAMLPGATSGQIYVRDLQADTIELVSRSASASSGSTAFAYRPAISPNGRFVAFQSRGFGGLGYANGVDSAGNSGVYLRDRQAQATIAIPRPSAIPASDYDSCTTSAVSDVGSVVLGCNYAWTGVGSFPQVFLFVPGAGAPELLSATPGGQPGNKASGYSLAVNASGLSMAFESDASDIDADDTNNKSDIFVLVEESVISETIFADGFEAAPASRPGVAGRFRSLPVGPGAPARRAADD